MIASDSNIKIRDTMAPMAGGGGIDRCPLPSRSNAGQQRDFWTTRASLTQEWGELPEERHRLEVLKHLLDDFADMDKMSRIGRVLERRIAVISKWPPSRICPRSQADFPFLILGRFSR